MTPRDENGRSTEFLRHQMDRRTLLRRSVLASVAVPIAATSLPLEQVLAAQATPGAGRATGTPAADDKQVLRIAVTAPFRMDPPTNAAGLWALQSVVFMALGRVDATNKVIPGVADSWTSTADRSSWTFKLNPKAAFSDGTPITADDVKWTWEWYSSPKSKSLGSQNVAGTITGYDAVSGGKSETLDGIVVEDPQTVTFKLTGPDPMFLAKAAVYNVGILKRDNLEKGGEEWWRAGHLGHVQGHQVRARRHRHDDPGAQRALVAGSSQAEPDRVPGGLRPANPDGHVRQRRG